MLIRRNVVLIVLFLSGTLACNPVTKLRTFFRGDPSASRLYLEITPTQNLSISIDGHVIGTASPFEEEGLTVGQHKLTVAAMDHYSFVVPIDIKDNESLTLRIALRPVPAAPQQQRVTTPREPRPRAQQGIPPPTPLPQGVQAIDVAIAGDPSGQVVVDGEIVANKAAELAYVTGEFGMGRARIAYRVGGAGVLELKIPDDGAQWFRDGEPLEVGSKFAFYRGKTRLQQIQPNGETQVVLLGR